MTNTSLAASVAKARRAWNRALGLALVGSGLGMALVGAAVVVLVGKALGLDLSQACLWGAVPVALLVAGMRFPDKRVDDQQMATLLDLRQGGQGHVVHALERQLAHPMSQPLATLTRPRPAGRRLAASLGPGVIALVIALFVPLRATIAQPHERLAEQRLDELAEQASSLEEVLDLEEELQAELAENLESAEQGMVDRELTGLGLQEALDQIEQRLADVAKQAADALDAARSELARTTAELDAGRGGPETQEQLEALAAELAELGALPDGASLPDLSDLPASALARQLDQAALDKLAELAERGLLGASRLADAAELALGRGADLPPLPAMPERPEGTGAT